MAPIILIGLALFAAIGTVWWVRRQSGMAERSTVRPTDARDGGPPSTSSLGPFKNTHPAVEYVGDAACARCHAEIAQSYRAHPMGRSLARVEARSTVASPSGETRATFDAGGFRYAVEDRGGRIVHRESRLDAGKEVVVAQSADVRFALGSGTRGTAFLVERGGFLTQSPISWVATAKRWDLSPGYEAANPHFERPITHDCLYCHANRYLEIPGTTSGYREPIFEGQAIGCERCHGPGGLHVKRRELQDGRDLTIVNPRELEPALRDAVCEQCHLKGDYRILRDKRDVYPEYRPGLPLQRFLTVFFNEENLVDRVQAVGHVEQMHGSRCFQASKGALGCISCHDPHRRPAEDQKVAYFRGRCLECHETRSCALPVETRLRTSKADDCVQCHMPRAQSEDIAHAAMTDHRIPRRPIKKVPLPGKGPPKGPPSGRLVHFHSGLVSGADEAGIERDRGLALSWLAYDLGASDRAVGMAREALAKLEPVVRAEPDDLAALESRGLALAVLGRAGEASSDFLRVLEKEPRRENSLVLAAVVAARTNSRREAIALWRRALEINPNQSARQLALADLLAKDGVWAEAADVARKAVLINPTSAPARKLLVQCYRRLGDLDRARAELEVLLRLEPKDRDSLRRWYDEQE